MAKTNTTAEREFFDAVANSQSDTVRELVQADPKLLESFDYSAFGATPITRVCFYNNREMIQTLIELGADVNRRSDWHMGPWSPLHSAIFVRNRELAEFLLKSGATMDVHTAAGLGLGDELEKLLDEDPSRVSELGGDGCQPLHFADSPEVAELLLARGADIEARCIDHYSTPVQYLSNYRPEVAKFLFSKGAKADIFSAIMAGDLVTAQELMAENPEVLEARINQETFPPGEKHDVKNIMTFSIGGDSTPMHAAAKGNHGEIVKWLVDAGLSPDVRGGYDNAAPLHIAAWEDNAEATESLIKCGADINARSGEIHKNSPAGWAIVAGSANAFDVLMDYEAEVLDHFMADADAAVDGEFLQYKFASTESYERIKSRLMRRA